VDRPRRHGDLAQPMWASVLEAGDIAVDATCGNGNDALFLARAFADVLHNRRTV